MLYEVNFVLDLSYIGYLLIGVGFGYLVTLGVTGSYRATKLDRMKDDLAAKKEWIRMVSEAKKQKGKYNAPSRL
jgi:thiosulfate reductase cytochrome b subunit